MKVILQHDDGEIAGEFNHPGPHFTIQDVGPVNALVLGHFENKTTKFELIATHKPTDTAQKYGPWDSTPWTALSNVMFAQGFVSGWNNHEHAPDFKPEDLDFRVVEIPETPQANVIGELVAHATASVTHPDGSVS